MLYMQAFDVNMNTTAASLSGSDGGHPEGILPNGLSTIQGQVSGFKGQFIPTNKSMWKLAWMWISVHLTIMLYLERSILKWIM